MFFEKNIIKYLLDCHTSAMGRKIGKDCERLAIEKLPIESTDSNYTKFLLLMLKAERQRTTTDRASDAVRPSGLIYADCFVGKRQRTTTDGGADGNDRANDLQPLYFADVDFKKTNEGFDLKIGEKTLNVNLIADLIKDDEILDAIVDGDMSECDVINLLVACGAIVAGGVTGASGTCGASSPTIIRNKKELILCNIPECCTATELMQMV